jgi:Tc toxin complex TcA C-terminal TcB-binding domain
MKGSYHQYEDSAAVQNATAAMKAEIHYRFENFFHPFVGHLVSRLNKKSLSGVFDADDHQALATDPANKNFFDTFYNVVADNLIEHSGKEIELNGGPYSNYNWEFLFHFPYAVGSHLSKNQRFAEAMRWFHLIFDPTSPDKQYWKFLRFRQITDVTPIDEQLALLSKDESELTTQEAQLKSTLLESYNQITIKPFQPHPPAMVRVFPYQFAVFGRYFENLIAWGDSLFRQDTVESINEATQLYVLAANIIGVRAQKIPQRGRIKPKTFHQLKYEAAHGLDEFSNALVQLEAQFPFNSSFPSSGGAEETGPFGGSPSMYFCVPPNPKLLSYWDIVEDRLFKIRNCMNLEGVVRQLALFDPPIDPAMLVKAVAAGIGIGSIVSGLNQPVGQVRATVLIQKALEIASELRALGSSLLSAIEKQDSETVALLRQRHEVTIHRLNLETRFLQWKQAQESTEGLLKSRASALERYRYYTRLLNLPPDPNASETLALDRRDLTEDNFDEAYSALVGQYEKAVAPQPYPPLAHKEEGRLRLLTSEYAALNVHPREALLYRTVASASEVITAGLALIPDLSLKAAYWGIGPETRVTGGTPLSFAGIAISSMNRLMAEIEDKQAQQATTTASYERRADDWLLQCNTAARDLAQIGRQILGSLIAEQAARRDYLTVQKHIELAEEMDQHLQSKYTNEEFYAWMHGELFRLYYEHYRFAFDTARKAEHTMKRELMRPEVDTTDYIKFNYWDGGRKGLLSGEALHFDLKRMELAYHEHNKRELELTRHVSLRQLNPMALLALKATRTCEFSIPEWFLNFDGFDHFARRIKTVSVSIPSVAASFTSVNCSVSLIRSTIRKSPLLADGEYARQGSEDDRFLDYYGTAETMVTSTGNNDNGMFEANLREERPLPFEGAGAESTWRLELPAAFPQFDYDTISDVILHLRYFARPGGALLGSKAREALEDLVTDANAAGLRLMFSLRHDFPNEWHKFVTANAQSADPAVPFTATLRRDYFPYFTNGRTVVVDSIQVVATDANELKTATLKGPEIATFAAQLVDSGEATFSTPLTSAVTEVLSPTGHVFIVIKYALT